MRFILLAEHTECSFDDNPLTNTRTTLTWFPIKFMMWNMPFHAEHHLYPSLPFHALPQAHQELKEHFAVVDDGKSKNHCFSLSCNRSLALSQPKLILNINIGIVATFR